PNQISVGGLQRILQNLLQERISIRDLPTILEGISEACSYTRNVTLITEHVRTRLARQLTDANTNHRGQVLMATPSAAWEQASAESLRGAGEEKQLAMAPTRLQAFIRAARETFDPSARKGDSPS